ncbi:MAG: hypothetical protein DMG57_29355 [Acidobacteria bacterium]|nr:MAG: hypothetical protein DMG57_29355 [Acidobacteriota bacterium]
MKIYLDACCLNRLTDDQNQPRFAKKPGLLSEFSNWFATGLFNGFPAMSWPTRSIEIRIGKRGAVALASKIIEENDQIAHRGKALHRAGYAVFDAPGLRRSSVG